jgi:hypothetical protein
MPYDRMAALTYAGAFYDKVCHDARVATKGGYPARINNVLLTPGLPLNQIGAITGEDDCTHFISCCVGQGKGKLQVGGRDIDFPGGGLAISSPFQSAGVYGETYTPRLVGALIFKGVKIVPPQFMVTTYAATRTSIQRNLRGGDVLAYASSANLRSDGTGFYEHMCLLLGSDGKIACHTSSRFGKDYTDVYFPWVTLLQLP